MKSEIEIKHKYDQLVGRHLEKLFQKHLSSKPWNCTHNYMQSGTTVVDGKVKVETTGLCMYNSNDPRKWEGKICETVADSYKCPYFNPVKEKQQIYDEYMKVLNDPDLLQHEYRDLYILQWVLGPETIKIGIIQKIKNFFIKSKSYKDTKNIQLSGKNNGNKNGSSEMSVEDISKVLFS